MEYGLRRYEAVQRLRWFLFFLVCLALAYSMAGSYDISPPARFLAASSLKVNDLKSHVHVPVLIGSGTTTQNVVDLMRFADGAIVGSAFKRENNWKNPIDVEATRAFMDRVRELRETV